MGRRLDLLLRLTGRTISKLLEDDGPQLAAAIAYRVLFSIFPLVIVLSGIFGIVVRATGVRADVVDAVVRNVPLDASGEESLRKLLEGATGGDSAVGLVAFVGVVWAASGMMAAIRSALNRAWDVEDPRPFLRGKLVDVALVFAAGLGVLASLALTIAARALGGTLARAGVPADSGWAQVAIGALVPLALAFGVTLFLYRAVPAAEVRLEDAWPAALGTAVAFVGAQNLFAVYVDNFANYNAIYGSLGAVIAFMFFVYLASLVFLVGAQAAAALPHVRAEQRAADPDAADGEPFLLQAKRLLKGLWIRTADAPEEEIKRS